MQVAPVEAVSTSTSALTSPLAVLREHFGKLLKLPAVDLWAVDFLLTLVLAAKAGRNEEPVFGALVGPPSTGKTLLLLPYMGWEGMSINYSDMTQNALASGSPIVDRPLLAKINRRTLVIKEMTAILSGNPLKRDIFFATLRDAFDGSHTKHSGAYNEAREFKTRFSVAAGVTDEIYRHMETDTDMGQRFLFFRIFRNYDRTRRIDIAMNILNNKLGGEGVFKDWNKQIVRQQMEALRVKYVDPKGSYAPELEEGESDKDFQCRVRSYEEETETGWHCVRFPDVTTTDAQNLQIFSLCETVVRARSGKLTKDRTEYSTEGNTRLINQLKMLTRMRALADFRTAMNEDDLEFMRGVARDTLMPSRLRVLRVLQKHDEKGAALEDFCSATHLPQETIQQLLVHYQSQEFVYSVNGLWRLTKDAMEDLNTCNILA